MLQAEGVQVQAVSEFTSPDALREMALFGGLGDETLQFLSEVVEVRELPVGTALFSEGERGRDLFVITKGRVEISRRAPDGHKVTLRELGPGDSVGEMSVVDVLPRHTSAHATEETTLVGLSCAKLDLLYRKDLKAYSMLLLNMAREMSRRLRVADERTVVNTPSSNH